MKNGAKTEEIGSNTFPRWVLLLWLQRVKWKKEFLVGSTQGSKFLNNFNFRESKANFCSQSLRSANFPLLEAFSPLHLTKAAHIFPKMANRWVAEKTFIIKFISVWKQTHTSCLHVCVQGPNICLCEHAHYVDQGSCLHEPWALNQGYISRVMCSADGRGQPKGALGLNTPSAWLSALRPSWKTGAAAAQWRLCVCGAVTVERERFA